LHLLEPGVNHVVEDVSAKERARRCSAARAQLGLAETAGGQHLQWLLFVANDTVRKGLPTLLRALPSLPVSVHLAVVGAVPHEQVATAEDLGVSHRVQWLGSLPDVTIAYASADVLVHPTLEDTFAMVVLEAMAEALPVVVSGPDHCGIAAHLCHRHDAMLLKQPTDVEELARAIQTLLGDAELRQHLAVAGLRIANQHLWSQVAEQQASIYANLC
jgi:UDP-glucose:(heptosyl)LPS alpha-1,3-glucosyltransferase